MTATDLSSLLDDSTALARRIEAKGIPGLSNQESAALLDWLRGSVVRPIARVAELATKDGEESPGAHSPADIEAELRKLARRATFLSRESTAPLEVMEAAAGLQRISCALTSRTSPESATAWRAELRSLLAERGSSIRTMPNGPLIATNVRDLRDSLGQQIDTQPIMTLCRCGASASKPFCDGAHATGFDDAKDPERVPDRRDTYIGQQVTILDNRGTCQHSGYCTDRVATVFRLKEEPFVAPSGGRMDEIIRAMRDCPSGALSYAIDGVEARADVDYHDTRTPSIEVTKDGPYRIRGSISLLDASGGDVARNAGASREHYALCRCGHGRNKPFCTGMHWYVDFLDPVRSDDAVPTMFEWAGGLPSITRMTRLFYEKYVPTDELLAPLFARMSPDHPERVAEWLSEVFGGPKRYSEEHGGYSHMLSQHIAKRLTDEMRGRWVTLLLQSAREAGLPNDAEFRSAFQAYIEWGTRLAVENSQTDAKPPLHMPMPHWDWNTSAGPPGSRASATAPRGAARDETAVLPNDGEPITFAKHVKSFFRARDRNSMKFAFDLWLYVDVSTHADAILGRLRNGSMPCDGAWPADRVDAFARWVAEGKAE